MDDLANPAVASTWWSAGYTNNLIEAYAGTASTNMASVNWQAVRAVADSIDVDSNGVTVLAAYWSGSAGSRTVNGVTFTDSGGYTQSQNGITVTATGSSLALMPGGDTSASGGFFNSTDRALQGAGPDGYSYAALLGSGVYGSGAGAAINLTLSGLTTGHQYRVQFWTDDARYTNGASETLSASTSDTNIPTLNRRNAISPAGVSCYNRNGGTYVIGTFTAASGTQTFTVKDTSGSGPQINDFQLRDVTGLTISAAAPYSPAQAVGTAAYVGIPFTYYTNLGTFFFGATNFGATGLPPGLALNSASGVISGTPSDAGIYHATISGICAGVTYQATMIFVIAPAQGTPALSTSVPRGYLNNVAESTNYSVVYSLSLPWTGNYSASAPPYSVDLHAGAGPFTRVAYYLELQTPAGALQYVWVSMNAFTTNAAQIGVPTIASGASFQQAVTNLNVISDVPGVVNGTGLAGSLVFSPANSGLMLVSNTKALFGFTNWAGTGGYAFIGFTNPVAATNYSVRSLQVLVLDSAGTITVQPVADDLTLLLNPGKGYANYWPPYYYPNVTGAGYERWDWSAIEPAEGVYNWTVVDSAISGWAAAGRKIALGFMSTDCNYNNSQPTPAWVFQPGTNATTGSVYHNGAVAMSMADPCGSTNAIVIPASWDDTNYLGRLHEFIAALGARYDGNTNIAYLDLRDYGLWGEGWGGLGTTTNLSAGDLLTNYYLPYVQYFPNTQLLSDAWYGSAGTALVNRGAGARTDGICSGSGNGSFDLMAYPYHPSVMEYWGLSTNVYRAGPENELMIYIAAGRPTYLQFNGDGLYPTLTNFYNLAANSLGYHFFLQQATVPKVIQTATPFTLNWSWFNDGVAPLFQPAKVALALLDSGSNVVQKQWLSGSNPQGWLPGVSTSELFTNINFTGVSANSYKLAVGLFAKTNDVNPTYRLAQQGRTTNGWYVLAGVSVTTVSIPSAPANLTVTAGDGQVAASWNVVAGANAYNLKRATNNGGPYTMIAGNWSGLTFTNGGLTNGILYYYVVAATNSAGESTNSAVVSARPVSLVRPSLTANAVSGILSLAWPADHTGWRLLMQTNHTAGGVSANPNDWAAISGSAAINQTNLVVNPAQPAGFYQLVYP